MVFGKLQNLLKTKTENDNFARKYRILVQLEKISSQLYYWTRRKVGEREEKIDTLLKIFNENMKIIDSTFIEKHETDFYKRGEQVNVNYRILMHLQKWKKSGSEKKAFPSEQEINYRMNFFNMFMDEFQVNAV